VSEFQILCLSGGGYRGLYTATVLEELEAKAKKPLAECFDLIAGTSIGGILALGLAAGRPAREIREAFESRGAQVFSPKRPSGKLVTLTRILTHLWRPLYSSVKLAEIIDEILPSDTRVGDLCTRIVIPTVNLTKGEPQVFKTPHHIRFERDHTLLARDVALATSAAPTFFSPHEIDGELFADGGLYANSPDEIAIHEALHFLNVRLEDVRMLSIGTTTSSFAWSAASSLTAGYLDWTVRSRLMNATIGSQQINSDYVMRHRLGERYLRLDAQPSAEQAAELGLDVASEFATRDLIALARATVRSHIGDNLVNLVLPCCRAEPKFYHGTKA
jgi:patatin-like phospholipase/acyl hydrolase